MGGRPTRRGGTRKPTGGQHRMSDQGDRVCKSPPREGASRHRQIRSWRRMGGANPIYSPRKSHHVRKRTSPGKSGRSCTGRRGKGPRNAQPGSQWSPTLQPQASRPKGGARGRGRNRVAGGRRDSARAPTTPSRAHSTPSPSPNSCAENKVAGGRNGGLCAVKRSSQASSGDCCVQPTIRPIKPRDPDDRQGSPARSDAGPRPRVGSGPGTGRREDSRVSTNGAGSGRITAEGGRRSIGSRCSGRSEVEEGRGTGEGEDGRRRAG